MTSDEKFMQRAVALAAAARDHDEVPVGAVLVRDGAIVAEAGNGSKRARTRRPMRRCSCSRKRRRCSKAGDSAARRSSHERAVPDVRRRAGARARGPHRFRRGRSEGGRMRRRVPAFRPAGAEPSLRDHAGVLRDESLGLLQDFFRLRRAEGKVPTEDESTMRPPGVWKIATASLA